MCLIVIIIASALGGAILQSHYTSDLTVGTPSSVHASLDPLNNTGSPYAFNYSYSQANLYTNSGNPPNIFPLPNSTAGTQLRWLNTVVETKTNTTIPTSGFRFNITAANLPTAKQDVNWTLTVPQFNCKGCTGVSVNFIFFGNVTKGTNATYTLYPLSPPNSTKIASQSFTALGQFPSSTSVSCPETICIDVTKYAGYNLTLSFRFAWNGTNASGMSADVGEIVVASIGGIFPSSSNLMQQDPTNPSRIIHTAELSMVNYDNTLNTTIHPGNTNVTRLWWHMEVISIYYPAGYSLTRVNFNSTQIFPNFTPNPNEVPFERENCVPGTSCSQSLIALNMTDFYSTVHNSNITITSNTSNSISQLSTLSGGVATQFFTSGDEISVKVVNKPSITNAPISLQTGTLTITFPSALSIQPTPITTAAGGVYNFTLPSSCGFSSQLCATSWSFSAVFKSPYDLGNATGSFRIDSLHVSFTDRTGGNNALSVKGQLTYGNGTPASGVNATLFAIDRGTPINRPVTGNQKTTSTTSLYISNVTVVNGVFTQDQPLIILFTVVNPDPSKPYNATLTIEHEWPGPQPHNMSVTFSLHPGDPLNDLPFNAIGPQTYRASILFTGEGVKVTLTNLRTSPNFETQTMGPGTSPVLPNRPHAGLFNITITGKINATESPSSFILSKPYAYVGSSLVPSRYLAASDLIKTGSNGNFSAAISSDSLLGAKNMTVLLLARDATGIGLVNNLSIIGLSDSTVLVSTTESIGTVAKDQTVTARLHLRNNSTKITEVITVNLILQGNGMPPQTKATKPVTISPGDSQTVTLAFPAPSTIGSYTLTFSSPEYGGPLTSQTLQVAILQSNLQILIPASIGVVAAIIVLGVYLIRGRPAEEAEEKTKTKPAAGGTKTRPAPANPPSKSLTRTRGTEE